MFDFQGKRILISHTLISNIMGSTVVALELAEHFISRGAEVVVFASDAGGAMLPDFNTRGIKVIKSLDDDAEKLSAGDFDYIWVHSQIIPPSILSSLRKAAQQEDGILPIIIFHHMSRLAIAPDEHPYIPQLEEKLSDLSAFVSRECLDELLARYWSQLPGPKSKMVFPNSTPERFASHPLNRDNRQLERVAIVSNHIPDELRQATKLLLERGVEVVSFGEADTPKLLDPQDLADVDAVISIGKTVSTCLSMGIPVFLYDKFGGCGYLDDDCFEEAAYANFSGRTASGTFPKMTPDEITSSLISGYADAKAWSVSVKPEMESRYSLEKNIGKIFAAAESAPGKRERLLDISQDMWHVWDTQMAFALRYYRAWSFENWIRGELSQAEDAALKATEEISTLNAENDKTVAQLEDNLAKLRETQDELSALQEAYEKVSSELDGMRGLHGVIESIRKTARS